jgi:hypothetical protein
VWQALSNLIFANFRQLGFQALICSTDSDNAFKQRAAEVKRQTTILKNGTSRLITAAPRGTLTKFQQKSMHRGCLPILNQGFTDTMQSPQPRDTAWAAQNA